MFAKYCQGKDVGEDIGPVETALPNMFDPARRTSVSAECWASHGGGIGCAQSSRMPARTLSASDVTGGSANPAEARGSGSANGSKGVYSDVEMKKAKERASASLRSTIFFEELSDNLMQLVLEALEPRALAAGAEVIKQGDEGNELFILDEGKVEFFVNNTKQGEAESGSTFGELALLYNSPRAATVRTVVPSKVFALDRVTFKRIMVAKLSDKRMHSQQVLASIDAFSQLSDGLRLRISDALHPETYKKGDVILKEGDLGCNFYLIDEGTVNVTKDGELLGTLSSGRYFGELALIYDLPRTATITATSNTLKLEVLSKTGFEQLIGPDLVSELRRRDPRKQ